jgi:hypothetical protein
VENCFDLHVIFTGILIMEYLVEKLIGDCSLTFTEGK